MFIYIQALDFNGKLLKVEVDQQESAGSLKDKVNHELGGDLPDELLHTLSYVGIPLECNRSLDTYNIRESSLLYLGRHLPYPYGSPTQSQQPHSPQPLVQVVPPGPYEVIWG